MDFLHKPIEPAILLAKAAVFVSLQDRTEDLASERLQREFDEWLGLSPARPSCERPALASAASLWMPGSPDGCSALQRRDGD